METAKFLAFQSLVEPPFWTELASRKLDQLKLSEAPVPITGTYSAVSREGLPAFLRVDHASFDESREGSAGQYVVPGTLHNLNTLEAFHAADRGALLQQAASQLWADIASGAAEARPQLLTRLLLLTFADLKQYKFHYRFAFPALKPPEALQAQPPAGLERALGADVAAQVATLCSAWMADAATGGLPFWLLHLPASGAPALHPLTSWHELAALGGEVLLATADASPQPAFPAWPLRNALLLAAHHWRPRSLRCACLRAGAAGVDPARSTVTAFTLPDLPEGWAAAAGAAPAAAGWERGDGGGGGARVAEMRGALDPRALAEQAVDLNLRLMRWRFAPDLDVGGLAEFKCLLLGAGTLGCAVARGLLGWRVSHITLVDNGRVSFSNPVRQSLFTYEDCLQGGRPKAEAAAAALRAIYPNAIAEGIDLSIPMPGHPLSPPELDAARAAVERLDALVSSHDAVFLLTDTRESRWLPTLLAAAAGKLAVTAALAYDEFVVLRHGGPPGSEAGAGGPAGAPAGPRLGCYFCNDVVAPTDSTRQRSLDQQCTVTRPGLSFLAGGVAAELAVAVAQHPRGLLAGHMEGGGGLGAAPHMVRGSLSTFTQSTFQGHAFGQCPACSGCVVEAYRVRGWDFVAPALQRPAYLEDVTGLTALHESTAGLDFDLDEGEGCEEGAHGQGEDDWTTL